MHLWDFIHGVTPVFGAAAVQGAVFNVGVRESTPHMQDDAQVMESVLDLAEQFSTQPASSVSGLECRHVVRSS